MIPYTTFVKLLSCAGEYDSAEAYAAGCVEHIPMTNLGVKLMLLNAIYAAAHDGLTVRSIAATCCISMRQLAIRYGLPTRTVEHWAAGNRKPPEWQLPLIAYAAISDYVGDVAGETE